MRDSKMRNYKQGDKYYRLKTERENTGSDVTLHSLDVHKERDPGERDRETAEYETKSTRRKTMKTPIR